jgi:RHS repeat-associated protein
VGSDSTFLHSGIKNADTQTDDGGDVSAMRRYDAFGNPVAAWGGWQGPFGYGGPYGYQTDPDHGLMLLGHRYYEADTGRFLTRDPIKDGRNWYGYCGGNPVQQCDPSGERIAFKNGTTDQHFEFILAVIAIGLTKTGRSIADELLWSDTLYTIEFSTIGSGYDDEERRLLIRPRDYNWKLYRTKEGKLEWMTFLRVVAHEAAHIIIPGDSDDEQYTIDKYENPIMRELGDHKDRASHDKMVDLPFVRGERLNRGRFLPPIFRF